LILLAKYQMHQMMGVLQRLQHTHHLVHLVLGASGTGPVADQKPPNVRIGPLLVLLLTLWLAVVPLQQT
jgi:hypothetical protein